MVLAFETRVELSQTLQFWAQFWSQLYQFFLVSFWSLFTAFEGCKMVDLEFQFQGLRFLAFGSLIEIPWGKDLGLFAVCLLWMMCQSISQSIEGNKRLALASALMAFYTKFSQSCNSWPPLSIYTLIEGLRLLQKNRIKENLFELPLSNSNKTDQRYLKQATKFCIFSS